MEANNVNGKTRTKIIQATLSELPDKPSTGPYLDSLYISSNSMKVLIDEVTVTGGSSIESYELQQDDSKGGAFVTVFGGDESPTIGRSVILFNQPKGVFFRFRY